MRHRLVLAALVPAVVVLGGLSTAQAAPTSGAAPANHGQCVSGSPDNGPGGRSTTAKDKSACLDTLFCRENEDGPNTVVRNRADDEVTIVGSGVGSAGSSLECRTSIPVVTGDTISFTYELGEGTDPCGGGVPRVFIQFADGTYENTLDSDPQCAAQEDEGTVSYTIKATGTVVQVGLVYDRGDTGSVTYSDVTVGDVTLNF